MVDILLIDKTMMLAPPSPREWVVKGSSHPRFGWDAKYVESYGQKFSPWFFAKNCAAVLGHVRAKGASGLMAKMADHLTLVVMPHLEAMGAHCYVRSNFEYSYLGHTFKPPFYGAFMNNVTAFGFLHLYEATRSKRFLDLAERLLLTSGDLAASIPLCTQNGDDFWLHEYVFKSDGGAVPMATRGEWTVARIYNGHIHALLALYRFRAMTGTPHFDSAISRATDTMATWLPRQSYQGRYFSYTPDLPIYPDYGQRRAVLLAEGLAELANDREFEYTAIRMRDLFEANIAGNEKEIVASGIADAKRSMQAAA